MKDLTAAADFSQLGRPGFPAGTNGRQSRNESRSGAVTRAFIWMASAALEIAGGRVGWLVGGFITFGPKRRPHSFGPD